MDIWLAIGEPRFVIETSNCVYTYVSTHEVSSVHDYVYCSVLREKAGSIVITNRSTYLLTTGKMRLYVLVVFVTVAAWNFVVTDGGK